MSKSVPFLVAAMLAFGSVTAVVAADKADKPTAAQCKKDPKMAGCEKAKK